MTVCLAAADAARLARAAERAWPEEACALLEGTRGGVRVAVAGVHLADNVAADRVRQFEVDPRRLLALHRALRAGPTELVGVWHSHPDGSADLSETDRAHAFESGFVWLLTPVRDRRTTGIVAFRAERGRGGVRFIPMDLELRR